MACMFFNAYRPFYGLYVLIPHESFTKVPCRNFGERSHCCMVQIQVVEQFDLLAISPAPLDAVS